MITYKTKTVREYMSEGSDITRVIVEDKDEGEVAELDFIVDGNTATLIGSNNADWVDMSAAKQAALDA
jgi:hypothetical protein